MEDKLKFKKWFDLCEQAIKSMKITSVGPTRSGNQIQVRLSYLWDGKLTTGYQTSSRSVVNSFHVGYAVYFKEFLSGALRLHTAIRQSEKIDRFEADYQFDKIWAELSDTSIIKTSESIRKEIVRVMSESIGTANNKRDEVELTKCRKNLPLWIRSALIHGMNGEELHELVNCEVVSFVLKN